VTNKELLSTTDKGLNNLAIFYIGVLANSYPELNMPVSLPDRIEIIVVYAGQYWNFKFRAISNS